MKNKKLTCINCPEGCTLDIVTEGQKIFSISGNRCKKGLAFAENEIFNPTRILTTTVSLKSKDYSRLPVRSSSAINKKDIFSVIKDLKEIKIEAPVKMGEIVFQKEGNTEIIIVASMSVEK